MSGKTFDPTFDADESRFHKFETAAGWPTSPDLNTGREWLRLADECVTQAEPYQPETRSVQLKRVGRLVGSDEYAIVERSEVSAAPTIAPAAVASPRFKKRTLHGGAYLDQFLSREPGGPWHTARPDEPFQALLEWADSARPSQQALNDANIALCVALAARAGILLHPSQVPGWPQ